MPAAPLVFAVFTLSIVSLAVGNTLLKVGMDRLGGEGGWLSYGPVVAGVALLIVQFAGMLTLFRWGLGVSVVIPIFGLNYLVTALLGRHWLGEPLGPARLAGILLLVLGAGLVARGDPPVVPGPAPAAAEAP